jgi:hypothetical protein
MSNAEDTDNTAFHKINLAVSVGYSTQVQPNGPLKHQQSANDDSLRARLILLQR